MHEDQQAALQEAAERIRIGDGTLEDEKMIDRAFQTVKQENIRELRKMGRRTKWLRR